MQSKVKPAAITGLAAVAAMGAAAACMMGGRQNAARRRALKRSTAKAARAVGSMVGDVVDQVSGMIG